MSDYKIISKTEDASKERVFYTIEIAPFRFVDVMCIRNTSENYEYLIQNEDASYVYYELEYKYTYPGYGPVISVCHVDCDSRWRAKVYFQ